VDVSYCAGNSCVLVQCFAENLENVHVNTCWNNDNGQIIIIFVISVVVDMVFLPNLACAVLSCIARCKTAYRLEIISTHAETFIDKPL